MGATIPELPMLAFRITGIDEYIVELKTDQTQIKETKSNLKHVYDVFGDMKGKRV